MKENILFFLRRAGKAFVILVLLFLSRDSFAQQQVTVQGIVRDTIGGLPGVSIKVLGTSKSTITDAVGRFKIIVNSNDVLKFSFVGYKDRQIQVNQQKANANAEISLDVKLAAAESNLDEVTVV